MKTHQTYQTGCKKSAVGTALSRKGAIVGLVLLGSLVTQAGQGPQPSICTRSCWGARASTGCANMSTLNRAMVHHTAGTADYTTDYETGKARVRGVQNMHIDINGWCDIGYHFLINAGGHIYEGRYNSMAGLPIGTYDGCYVNSFGFSVLGYYHPPYYQSFTSASRNSLEAVIAWRMPSAWSPYGSGTYCGATVGFLDGHRSVGATACPGDTITVEIPSIRDGVNARKNPPPPSGLVGGIDACSWGTNRLDVFGRGTDNALWHQWSDGGSWNYWQPLGGQITSETSAVSWGNNRIDVFARGTGGDVKHLFWTGSSWSSWLSLGGNIIGGPDACSWGVNRIDVFARGLDSAVWHTWWSGGPNWNPWHSLGGYLTSDPTACSWGANRIDVFGRGANGDLVQTHTVNGTSWSPWISLGGSFQGSPDACSWGPNRIDIIARGNGNDVIQKVWTGTGWSTWYSLGGIINADPSACSWGVNRVDIFGVNTDVYHRWWDGAQWVPTSGPWQNLGHP